MARHHVKVTGLLGPVTQTWAPARVCGVRQYGGEVMPHVCPHCASPWSEMASGWAHCRPCGQYWYRTVGTIAQPVSPRGLPIR